MSAFSPKEMQRYARHFTVPEIGLTGQAKLKATSVLLIGAGGIGSPAALYLAACGVGRIGIIDHDTIELSNLQRQILYQTAECGQKKAVIAGEKIAGLNPHVQCDVHPVKLTQDNADNLFAQYDIIVDGSDNYNTRYLVSDTCVALKKPLLSASILQFTGQLGLFCGEDMPCYRCLYSEPPPADATPNCSEAGVLGVLPGILSTLAVNELIKYRLGIGSDFAGKVLCVDALTLSFKTLHLPKDPECPACGQGQKTTQSQHAEEGSTTMEVPHLSVTDLQALQQNQASFTLLDVRETWECAIAQIENSLHIPLMSLPQRVQELDRHQPLVVYCKSGHRSAHATVWLLSQGFQDVRNLDGGILDWIAHIDPTLLPY